MDLPARVPTALALRRPAAVLGHGVHPFLPPLAMIALGAGVISGSLVFPIGLVTMIFVTGLLALVAANRSTPSLGALLAAERLDYARRARRLERDARLPFESFGRQTLQDATRLVDDITARDPALAERLDLEALLDRQVTLTLAHERALRALRMGDRVQLERMRDSYRSDPGADPRRIELCERRLRSHHACEARAQHYADELANQSDLLALIAQRVECPDDPPADDTLERELAELDGDDAARRQVDQQIT